MHIFYFHGFLFLDEGKDSASFLNGYAFNEKLMKLLWKQKILVTLRRNNTSHFIFKDKIILHTLYV